MQKNKEIKKYPKYFLFLELLNSDLYPKDENEIWRNRKAGLNIKHLPTMAKINTGFGA